MKKTILAGIFIASLTLSLAACKNNAADRPETSVPAAQSSMTAAKDNDNTDNGKVTDGNGIIGDSEDKTANRTENSGGLISEVVSDTESIVESVGEGIENGASKVESFAESTTEKIGEFASNTVSNTESLLTP